MEGKVKEHQPDVLVSSASRIITSCMTGVLIVEQFCASMWTVEEAEQILSTARSIRPDIKTHAIPHGLQVDRGPDAIVEHLLEKVPALLES